MAKSKSKEEIQALAGKVIELLVPEHLPIWQAREVLTCAKEILDWVTLKEAETEVPTSHD